MKHTPDPELDLVIERTVSLSAEKIWQAWTTPDLIKHWFTPAPWRTTACEIDLRPGGCFVTTMQGPNGPEFSAAGCILEVVPNVKLVWTSALGPGYRPQLTDPTDQVNFTFTAVISMETTPEGTKYSALAIHPTHEAQVAHAGMGFHDGWGAAFDQLVTLMS